MNIQSSQELLNLYIYIHLDLPPWPKYPLLLPGMTGKTVLSTAAVLTRSAYNHPIMYSLTYTFFYYDYMNRLAA